MTFKHLDGANFIQGRAIFSFDFIYSPSRQWGHISSSETQIAFDLVERLDHLRFDSLSVSIDSLEVTDRSDQ